MEDDDNAIWMHDNGKDVLRILVVSLLTKFILYFLMSSLDLQTNNDIHDSSQSMTPFSGLSTTFHGCSHTGSCSTSVHSTRAPQCDTPAEPTLLKEILIQLGISPDMLDQADGGLCHAYEKYKAYLQACKTYGEMVPNKS